MKLNPEQIRAMAEAAPDRSRIGERQLELRCSQCGRKHETLTGKLRCAHD